MDGSRERERRYERQARNEGLLRSVNEQIASLGDEASGWADAEQRFEFQCECGRPHECDDRLSMTFAEYERVRSQRDRFAVAPGHETPAIERVVHANDRFLIVDKRDEFEHLVE